MFDITHLIFLTVLEIFDDNLCLFLEYLAEGKLRHRQCEFPVSIFLAVRKGPLFVSLIKNFKFFGLTQKRIFTRIRVALVIVEKGRRIMVG